MSLTAAQIEAILAALFTDGEQYFAGQSISVPPVTESVMFGPAKVILTASVTIVPPAKAVTPAEPA